MGIPILWHGLFFLTRGWEETNPGYNFDRIAETIIQHGDY
jgi:hypothetical protein